MTDSDEKSTKMYEEDTKWFFLEMLCQTSGCDKNHARGLRRGTAYGFVMYRSTKNRLITV